MRHGQDRSALTVREGVGDAADVTRPGLARPAMSVRAPLRATTVHWRGTDRARSRDEKRRTVGWRLITRERERREVDGPDTE